MILLPAASTTSCPVTGSKTGPGAQPMRSKQSVELGHGRSQKPSVSSASTIITP